MNVDTTAQEKAIAYLTDARLYHVMRGKLVKLAKVWGVCLRQNYERVSKKALLFSGRYFHARQAKRAQRLCGKHRIKEVFVDRGYSGHGYEGEVEVYICNGNRREELSPRLKRLRKRRSAIEPVIGRMKNDGRLGRDYLLGDDGVRMNVVFCACGQNLRLLPNRIRRGGVLFSIFVRWLNTIFYRLAAFFRVGQGMGADRMRAIRA